MSRNKLISCLLFKFHVQINPEYIILGEIKYTNVHIIGCFACRSLLMEITVSRCYLVQLLFLGRHSCFWFKKKNMKFALNFIWIEMFSLKVKYLISLMVQSFIFFETPPLHVYFHLSPQHLCKTLLCIYELAVQFLFYFHHRMY